MGVLFSLAQELGPPGSVSAVGQVSSPRGPCEFKFFLWITRCSHESCELIGVPMSPVD